MALNFPLLLEQLEGAIREFAIRNAKGSKRLEEVVKLYPHYLEVAEKLKEAKTTWLIPEIVEKPWNFPLPPRINGYAVLSVDSSHIPPDRHLSINFFLTNLGAVILEYGKSPQAILESQPRLFYKEEDLNLREPGGWKEVPVEGVILGVKRSIEELRFLVKYLFRLPPSLPSIALWDGSLILWGLTGQTFPAFVPEVLLVQGFIPELERVRKADIPLAGYISFPHSTEVINLLRLILCPYEPVDCDKFCSGREKACKALDGLEDRELFSAILNEGERSPLFASSSQIVLRYYGEHRIYFFYLKLPNETARVELPMWAIKHINLIHALVYDQALKGNGYPVALMEAHQQADLSGGERERFHLLLARLCQEQGLPFNPSPKRRSKQIPWI